MAFKIGNTLIVGETRPGNCSQCGKHDDLRPYGPAGSLICFDCGMKDEEACRQRALQQWGRFTKIVDARQG